MVAGLTVLATSGEPDSDYINPEPWLVVLDSRRIGIEFITYGAQYSAVLYGIVDERGNWVAWPSPVTPRFGYTMSPSGAVAISDSQDRVHIAWSLFDPEQHVQTFHYLQLDNDGRITVSSAQLGSAPVASDLYQNPVRPGIRVTEIGVDVVWPGNGTFWVAPLDLQGRPISPPFPSGTADNSTFPLRVPAPGGSDFDSYASTGSDGGGNSFYVWHRSIFRQVARQPISEYELHFLSQGSSGPSERLLYSTADSWWWGAKPLVIPAFTMLITGIVVAPISEWRFRRSDSRKGP